MFFKLIFRNSNRSRKENLLFLSSLVISILSFYVVLSLKNQDVVRYLDSLESDAINKLMDMIIVLYAFTLIILFFLIYYASKYQIERRSHELGVYLMMGMRRSKLFTMLLAEDIVSSLTSLAIGLPLSVLVTELISLITVKAIGIGYIEHQTTFDLRACLITIVGFVVIKLLAFIILSFKLARKEVGTLLADAPDNIKKRKHPAFYLISSILGIIFLSAAYALAISGYAWDRPAFLMAVMFVGVLGTFLLFWGLRFFIGKIAKIGSTRKLFVFNFRQVEESVIYRSGTMAICSLLVLAAIVCFACGIGVFSMYGLFTDHVYDYTFESRPIFDEKTIEKNKEKDFDPEYNFAGYPTEDEVYRILEDKGVMEYFKSFDVIETGRIRITDDIMHTFDGEEFWGAVENYQKTDMPYYRNDTCPTIINADEYNEVLETAGQEKLVLNEGEVGLFISESFLNEDAQRIYNEVLKEKKTVKLAGEERVITGEVKGTVLVTDDMYSPSFGIIVREDDYRYFTDNVSNNYFVNAVIDRDKLIDGNYYKTLDVINSKLGDSIEYDSYLSNMGRQLFYLVAASYVTIYLSLIFLVIANTILGLQFLMGQKKTSGRYKTLIKLGADHKTLCASASKQIYWFFGMPIVVAIMSSAFGIRSLYSGILSSRVGSHIQDMMKVSLIVTCVLLLIECVYILVVRRSSNRFLLTLMDLDREE